MEAQRRAGQVGTWAGHSRPRRAPRFRNPSASPRAAAVSWRQRSPRSSGGREETAGRSRSCRADNRRTRRQERWAARPRRASVPSRRRSHRGACRSLRPPSVSRPSSTHRWSCCRGRCDRERRRAARIDDRIVRGPMAERAAADEADATQLIDARDDLAARRLVAGPRRERDGSRRGREPEQEREDDGPLAHGESVEAIAPAKAAVFSGPDVAGPVSTVRLPFLLAHG